MNMKNKIRLWLLKKLNAWPKEKYSLVEVGEYGFWAEGLQQYLCSVKENKWHDLVIRAKADKNNLCVQHIYIDTPDARKSMGQLSSSEYIKIKL